MFFFTNKIQPFVGDINHTPFEGLQLSRNITFSLQIYNFRIDSLYFPASVTSKAAHTSFNVPALADSYSFIWSANSRGIL